MAQESSGLPVVLRMALNTSQLVETVLSQAGEKPSDARNLHNG